MTEQEKIEEANKWLDLFTLIVVKESNFALTVDDFKTSLLNTLTSLKAE